MKPSFRPPTEHTVAEYDKRFHEIKALDIDEDRVRGWVLGAPPVEALIPDGYEVSQGWIRVFNPVAYEVQMRRLFGII